MRKNQKFNKILIANRGEIAVRVIRACKEMGIPTVAVHSQGDAKSLPVMLADESVCIGPAASKDSYLHAANIISAALITGADAIHPGYGLLSESSSFAEMCQACNIKFIGPPVSAIEMAGNKTMARQIMEKAGVPVIPGSKGAIEDEADALKIAAKIGYPLMVKASAGGGGRGIRLVHSEEELPKVIQMAKQEAEAAFGSPELYMERYIDEPRHIEFQILADEHGHAIHLGERNCSIQTSRHQKMIEESPSPGLDSGIRHKMGEAAVRAAKAVGYTNAGTIEFLLDKNNNFYFMETNTRIQVEHPITEMVTGVDLIKQQILIAAGEKLTLSQKNIHLRGCALECRITAEDPDRGFIPSAGVITHLRLPGGYGVRVDTHIFPGYEVPPYYDALLAKLIVWGENREEAINRMVRALDEFEIQGIHTNIEFQKKILANAFYRRGDFDVNFLRRRMGV